MVTWAEIDDFTQDLERLCDPIPIEVYIKEGIPFRLFPQNFKDLIIRIINEGLEDEHGEILVVKWTEAFENIHALITAGRHEDACKIFEKWFHHIIGSGVEK